MCSKKWNQLSNIKVQSPLLLLFKVERYARFHWPVSTWRTVTRIPLHTLSYSPSHLLWKMAACQGKSPALAGCLFAVISDVLFGLFERPHSIKSKVYKRSYNSKLQCKYLRGFGTQNGKKLNFFRFFLFFIIILHLILNQNITSKN